MTDMTGVLWDMTELRAHPEVDSHSLKTRRRRLTWRFWRHRPRRWSLTVNWVAGGTTTWTASCSDDGLATLVADMLDVANARQWAAIERDVQGSDPIRLHDCGRFHRSSEDCPTL